MYFPFVCLLFKHDMWHLSQYPTDSSSFYYPVYLLLCCYAGDTGDGIREWLKFALGAEFSFPHIRVIYPTAPAR